MVLLPEPVLNYARQAAEEKIRHRICQWLEQADDGGVTQRVHLSNALARNRRADSLTTLLPENRINAPAPSEVTYQR